MRGVLFVCAKIPRIFFRQFWSLWDLLRLLMGFYFIRPSLFLYDVCLFIYSIISNPYLRLNRRARKSFLRAGEVYGETPWRVLDRISCRFHISSQDRVLDLGCGLGKVCFWFSHIVKCQRVVGIDREESFIHFADVIGRRLSQESIVCGRLSYHCRDFSNVDYRGFSCVYFYGTSFSSIVVRKVIKGLHSLEEGAVVLSVSYPLTDFPEGREKFKVEDSLKVSFPWGRTYIYKNVRRGD